MAKRRKASAKTVAKTAAKPASAAAAAAPQRASARVLPGDRSFDQPVGGTSSSGTSFVALEADANAGAGPVNLPPKKGGPGGRRPGAGRKPFRPTAEDRARVALLAGLIKHEEIPKLVFNPQTGAPIDYKTLRRNFAEELDTGKHKLDARVGESLVKRALDHSHPQGATCAIFYLKTRCGWRETTVLEVEGKAGVLVAPGAIAVDDWLAQVQKRNEKAVEPGLEEPE